MIGLSPLVAAPWSRKAYAGRLAHVVRRYEHVIALVTSGDRRAQVALLMGHPGALLEAERTPEAALSSHARQARIALDALERGGPMPPAPDDAASVRVYALADLSWLALELRALRRLARRRRGAEALLEAYRGLDRPDPLPAPTAGLVQAAADIPGAQVRRRLIPLVGLRYGRPDLAEWLLPRTSGGGRVRVGASEEIVEGRARRIEAFGRTVAVFRHQGRVYALDDACPHRGGALGRGELSDGRVLCPLHGWAFDLETGAYDENPSLCVRTFRTEEVAGAVFVVE